MQVAVSFISIVIACAAFSFSVITWRDRASKDQRDLFLRLHERLADVDLQRGRRILAQRINSIDDAAALLRDEPNEYESVYRAISMLDIVALYAERGYIDYKLVLQEWKGSYVRAWNHGQYFIAERTSRDTPNTWSAFPHFRAMAQRAAEEFSGNTISSDKSDDLQNKAVT